MATASGSGSRSESDRPLVDEGDPASSTSVLGGSFATAAAISGKRRVVGRCLGGCLVG
jgi:hypothetical protein